MKPNYEMEITDVKATERKIRGYYFVRFISFKMDGKNVRVRETLPTYTAERNYEGFDTPAYNIERNDTDYEDWKVKDALDEWMKWNNL